MKKHVFKNTIAAFVLFWFRCLVLTFGLLIWFGAFSLAQFLRCVLGNSFRFVWGVGFNPHVFELLNKILQNGMNWWHLSGVAPGKQFSYYFSSYFRKCEKIAHALLGRGSLILTHNDLKAIPRLYPQILQNEWQYRRFEKHSRKTFFHNFVPVVYNCAAVLQFIFCAYVLRPTLSFFWIALHLLWWCFTMHLLCFCFTAPLFRSWFHYGFSIDC